MSSNILEEGQDAKTPSAITLMMVSQHSIVAIKVDCGESKYSSQEGKSDNTSPAPWKGRCGMWLGGRKNEIQRTLSPANKGQCLERPEKQRGTVGTCGLGITLTRNGTKGVAHVGEALDPKLVMPSL